MVSPMESRMLLGRWFSPLANNRWCAYMHSETKYLHICMQDDIVTKACMRFIRLLKFKLLFEVIKELDRD